MARASAGKLKEAGAERYLPKKRSLETLRAAAADCEGCPLFRAATQTVFGEGPARARIVLVGEVPGDIEDRAGKPFVGPAGKLLDRALAAARLDREDVYLTNAVKHFYFEARGKARLHKRPRPGDIRACRPWLDAEIDVLNPRVIVLLGATAAQSLLGSSFRVTQHRGLLDDRYAGAALVATLHPAAVLRAPDHEARERLFEDLVTDLGAAKAAAR
jgi:DNA polymerase